MPPISNYFFFSIAHAVYFSEKFRTIKKRKKEKIRIEIAKRCSQKQIFPKLKVPFFMKNLPFFEN